MTHLTLIAYRESTNGYCGAEYIDSDLNIEHFDANYYGNFLFKTSDYYRVKKVLREAEERAEYERLRKKFENGKT